MSHAVQGGMLPASVSDGRKHRAQAQSKHWCTVHRHVIKLNVDLFYIICGYIMHNKLTDGMYYAQYINRQFQFDSSIPLFKSGQCSYRAMKMNDLKKWLVHRQHL